MYLSADILGDIGDAYDLCGIHNPYKTCYSLPVGEGFAFNTNCLWIQAMNSCLLVPDAAAGS